MWASLIEIEETERSSHPTAPTSDARRRRPRWFWPVVAATAGFTAILFGIVIHITIEKNRVTVDVRRSEAEGKTAGDTGGLPAGQAAEDDHELYQNEAVPTFRPRISMGSPDDAIEAERDEKPSHRVRISKPFYLGVTEVTQAQYEAVVGNNPSGFSANGGGKGRVAGQSTDRYPVENVPWLDAIQFSNKLSEKEGKKPFYEIDGKEYPGSGLERAGLPFADEGGVGIRLPGEGVYSDALFVRRQCGGVGTLWVVRR